jgi:hypothetical protein
MAAIIEQELKPILLVDAKGYKNVKETGRGITFKEDSILDKTCIKDSISSLPSLLVAFNLNACATSSSICNLID